MTVKTRLAKRSARCSTRASARVTRLGPPNSVSASSGVGSFICRKTREPSSLGTAAAKTRKSGIVLTWTTVYGRHRWRRASAPAASVKNQP